MNTTPIAINPTLELNLAHTIYKKRGRILLNNALTAPAAIELAQMATTLPYHLTMNNAGDVVTNVSPEDIAARGIAFREQLMTAVYAKASEEFRYFYGQFEFDKNLEAVGQVGEISRQIWNFLNGAAFLRVIGKIIGASDLTRSSAQMSCYQPGHFLTGHDDDVKNAGRRAAFVLYLTLNWRADWGGLLQFIDRDGHVAEAFTPTLNSLAVFRVPTLHSVSMVTPLAQRGRYAITGWVH